MNFLQGFPVIATGTIFPSTFVCIDTTRDFGVKAATLPGILPIAVSQPGTHATPGLANAIDPTDTNVQPAATAGQQLGLFGVGDVCDLTVGSAAVTAGDLLKNDGNANGITASSNDYYGAIALESGNTGELITVLVVYGKK